MIGVWEPDRVFALWREHVLPLDWSMSTRRRHGTRKQVGPDIGLVRQDRLWLCLRKQEGFTRLFGERGWDPTTRCIAFGNPGSPYF